MSYLHHNRGSEDINKWLAEHQTGSNTNRITQHAFGSSYHPSRTTKATATYGQRDAPPMSSATSRLTVNITSPTGGSGASSPSLYRSGGIATQSGGATKSKMNLSPSNPPDNDRSSSPFSTRDNDRFYGSTIGQTEDPRTELRKYIDLLKEIQKIDIDKCEMKYKQAMESFDVDTLTKEIEYNQTRDSTSSSRSTESHLRIELDALRREVSELRTKLKEDEVKKKQDQMTYTAEAKREIDDLHMKLQEEEAKAIKKKEQFEEQIYRFKEQEQAWDKERASFEYKIDSYKDQMRKMERERSTAEKEKTDALTRLSKEMGSKLNDRNPNIADLSDSNRPTKLAEKYNELYDNEWTDALEELDSMGEEAAIRVLLHIIENSYTFCEDAVKRQLQDLQNVLGGSVAKKREAWDSSSYTSVPAVSVPTNVNKLLRECQKEISIDSDALFKEYIVSRGTNSHASKVPEYVKKCLELCWLMVIQDPPVALGKAAESGETFDPNTFKEYTKTGNIVSYTVWRPLILHENGPLLCKGTAQPIATSKPSQRAKSAVERSTRQQPDYGYGQNRPTTTGAYGRGSHPVETNLDTVSRPSAHYDGREQKKTDPKVDAMFNSTSRGTTASTRHERTDYSNTAYGTYNQKSPTDDGKQGNQRLRPEEIGVSAEKYRVIYGMGPKVLHTKSGYILIYYDGKVYTQNEWDLLNSSFMGTNTGSSYT